MTNNTHPGVGRCKHIIRHDVVSLAQLGIDPTQEPVEGAGPCLFKTWGLIPADAAKVVLTLEGEQPRCLREIGSTVYQYCPTGEATAGLEPGLFAAYRSRALRSSNTRMGRCMRRPERSSWQGVNATERWFCPSMRRISEPMRSAEEFLLGTVSFCHERRWYVPIPVS